MSNRQIRRAHERHVEREGRRQGRRGRKVAHATGAALGTTVLFAPAAQADTFEVENTDDSGAGSLRQAVIDANADSDPDVVVFQSGLTGTIILASQIEINQPVDIQGPGANVITVDGDDNDQVFEVNGAGRVVISGLTLTGGAGGNAGAIRSDDSSLTIADSVLTDNYSSSRGGALYSDGGTLEVSSSVFTANQADEDGGAIGVFNTDGDQATEVVIHDSVFTGNTAGDGEGGALYLASLDAGARVERSSFVGNTAGTDGGAIWTDEPADGDLVFDSLTIASNSAEDQAGGIDLDDSDEDSLAILQNSTVSGNTAGESGGGVRLDSSDPGGQDFRLTNLTVTGNTAGSMGGGVYLDNYYVDEGLDASDSALLTSSIVAGNTAPAGPDLSQDPSINTGSGSLVTGFSLIGSPAGANITESPAGSSITGQDPQLGPLADNGGPTQTHLPAQTSPVIDRGVAGGLTVDQRGMPRTVDLSVPNATGGDGTDIGSVEATAGADCRGTAALKIDGTGGADTLTGTAGADRIAARGGADSANALAGKDCVSGGGGKDKLQGAGGKDSLKGQAGRDNLKGGGGKDTLRGGGGKDRLTGGPGRDKLKPGGGKDRVNCGGGKDKVTVSANDKVSGNCEKVVIRG